jgi:hypothetical protein
MLICRYNSCLLQQNADVEVLEWQWLPQIVHLC